jgi:dynein heavy chain
MLCNFQEFDPEFIRSKSNAAAGLCSWVINIMIYYAINETVKPLRQALAQANAELKAAMDKLTTLRARLAVCPFLYVIMIRIQQY